MHAVHVDPVVSERLWLTTGDREGECFPGRSDDRFASVTFLGDGGQRWRSVGLLFLEERLVWLTDTHVEQNHVVSFDRRREEIALQEKQPTSSWYAATTTDGVHLVTTTVEPGPGIQTDRARLLASHDAIRFEPVAEFTKERLPMRLFGFGSLALPSGWLSGEGLVGLDGETLVGRLAGAP